STASTWSVPVPPASRACCRWSTISSPSRRPRSADRGAAMASVRPGSSSTPPSSRDPAGGGRDIRLLSFNIQAGAHFERYRHYVTRPWRHVLPHGARRRNLDKLATLVADFDIVALQEADAGSLRSGFQNQIEFLADRAGFGWFSIQTNRRIGGITHTCNALLMRQKPTEVRDYALPGTLPGRGALW